MAVDLASQILYASAYFGPFAALLVALVALFAPEELDPAFRPIDVPIDSLNLTVDFIVIGAGGAGCVMANRLTEIADWTVLILEAGYDENAVTDTPLANYNFWGSPIDWNYTTTPQPNACRILWNSTCYWPRGQVVGGSSTLGDFVALRGNRIDYDNWVAMGNPGWSYRECLPFFRRLEDFRYAPYRSDVEYHGVGGYQTIERPAFLTPLGPAFVQAGIELGYLEGDLNAAVQTGFMITQGMARRARRCSTGKAYLRPARNRTNLQVSLGSFVTRVLIDPVNMTAYGVQFTREGRNLTAYATKEVIVSGGTINSPQLLMLSGVGPRQQLIQHNIPVLLDLPVGNNLQDHIAVPMGFRVNTTVITPAQAMTTLSAVEYAQNRSGPLTSMAGVEAVSMMGPPGTPTPRPPYGIIFSAFPPAIANPNNLGLWAGLTLITRPQSRGTVTLNTSNPFDYPLINPNYLSTESDLNNLIVALNLTVAISNTTTFQRYNSTFFFEFYTGCLEQPPYSYEWFLCLAVNYSTTAYHPAGTCEMGPGGVVDSRLRVYNVTGLRVVDASILPTLTTGNINLPVIMVAERAADFIKQENNVSRAVLNDGNRYGLND